MDNLVWFWLFCYYFHLLFFIKALSPQMLRIFPPFNKCLCELRSQNMAKLKLFWGQQIIYVKGMIDEGVFILWLILFNYCLIYQSRWWCDRAMLGRRVRCVVDGWV